MSIISCANGGLSKTAAALRAQSGSGFWIEEGAFDAAGGHSRVETGFCSALNPAQILNLAHTGLKAAWYAPQFQADATLTHAPGA